MPPGFFSLPRTGPPGNFDAAHSKAPVHLSIAPLRVLVDRRVDIKEFVRPGEITMFFQIIIIQIVLWMLYGRYFVTKLCGKSMETSSCIEYVL